MQTGNRHTADNVGASAGIQLVLALALFLQARGLANLWRRIQIGRYVKIDDTR